MAWLLLLDDSETLFGHRGRERELVSCLETNYEGGQLTVEGPTMTLYDFYYVIRQSQKCLVESHLMH